MFFYCRFVKVGILLAFIEVQYAKWGVLQDKVDY